MFFKGKLSFSKASLRHSLLSKKSLRREPYHFFRTCKSEPFSLFLLIFRGALSIHKVYASIPQKTYLPRKKNNQSHSSWKHMGILLNRHFLLSVLLNDFRNSGFSLLLLPSGITSPSKNGFEKRKGPPRKPFRKEKALSKSIGKTEEFSECLRSWVSRSCLSN